MRTKTLTRKISCLMLMVQIAWLTGQFTPQSIMSWITQTNSLLIFSSSRRSFCCSWDLNKYPVLCEWDEKSTCVVTPVVRVQTHNAAPRSFSCGTIPVKGWRHITENDQSCKASVGYRKQSCLVLEGLLLEPTSSALKWLALRPWPYLWSENI